MGEITPDLRLRVINPYIGGAVKRAIKKAIGSDSHSKWSIGIATPTEIQSISYSKTWNADTWYCAESVLKHFEKLGMKVAPYTKKAISSQVYIIENK